MAKLTASKVASAKAFYQMAAKICPRYNLVAIEAITAQAMVESAWNTSSLSKKYFNFFGMKCGSGYKGASVNMSTKEEYKAGVITNIKANFRAYKNLEEGVKGYCEFIVSMSRYKNLLGCKDNATYIKNIKNDGWATDSKYISTLTSVLNTLRENGVFSGSTVTENLTSITSGKTYHSTEACHIWTKPSVHSPVVSLAKYGMAKDMLPANSAVMCTGVIQDGKDVWCKCPLGYFPFYYDGKFFLKN